VIPQSYVATASNIISNAFGYAIRGSMAVAFTQYLWHLLRAHSMKVSTVELLFCLRTNPFHLFKYSAYKATPVLCALAIFLWGTQVVTGFPPGAITVITSSYLQRKLCTYTVLSMDYTSKEYFIDYVLTSGRWEMDRASTLRNIP